MNKNKRKSFTVSMAALLCTVLTLSGTFAWQSISQTAKNEMMGEAANPGGRLHDDFNGNEGIKKVYVENFTDKADGMPIIVRTRLFEYMQIETKTGDGTSTVNVLTQSAEGVVSDIDNEYTWHIHKLDENSTTASHHQYWKWNTGGQTTYMPTFNKNKDSLKADINGTLAGANGAAYDDYVDYTKAENATKKSLAVYDADENNEEDGGTYSTEETHTAKETINGTVISMADWKAAGRKLGNYWVYDTDGWAYWANPLMPNTATGMLLNSVEQGIIGGKWYYAIWVECQMVTADDLGEADATGFYKQGQNPSIDAETLLDKLVAEMSTLTFSTTSVVSTSSTESVYDNEEMLAAVENDLKEEEESEEQQETTEEEKTDEDTDAEQEVSNKKEDLTENTDKNPETESSQNVPEEDSKDEIQTPPDTMEDGTEPDTSDTDQTEQTETPSDTTDAGNDIDTKDITPVTDENNEGISEELENRNETVNDSTRE